MYSQNIIILSLSILQIYTTKTAQQCTTRSLTVLAQMVAYLPLVQQVRGSILGGVVNFYLKIFNLGARWGGDVHFLIARLVIAGLD